MERPWLAYPSRHTLLSMSGFVSYNYTLLHNRLMGVISEFMLPHAPGMTLDQTCYMCDAVATTKEHAPPKCFFPARKDLSQGDVDLRKELVTVPSCEAHNTSRSRDDEYAMVVVVQHYQTNKTARNQFATKVIRALRRSPALTTRVYDKVRPARVWGQEKISAEVDLDRF